MFLLVAKSGLYVKELLRNEEKFGFWCLRCYLSCTMNFKHLMNELIEQGWRCYHIDDMPYLTRGDNIHSLAVRNLLEIQVYEGKSLVFVRDSYPKDKPRPKPKPPKYDIL